MKAILEFDLNDPKDHNKHKIMMAAEDMHLALFKITGNLKNKIEKEIEAHVYLQDNSNDLLDRVFEMIGEICYPVDDILDL